MTMTELPRRPFAEQAPPIDGLDQVRVVARGRRRRRALAVTGGGVGAATAAAVAMLVLAGGSGGLDVLRPVTPAHHGLDGVQHQRTSTRHHAASTRQVAPARQHGHGPAAPRVVARTGSDPTSVEQPAHTRTGRTPTGQTASATIGPQLQRYKTSTASTKSVNLCPGNASSTDSSMTTTGVGWCVLANVVRTGAGEKLHFQACRDDTGGGALTFAGSREIDITVKQGGRTVWDWAHNHPGTAAAHQLSTGSGECWNWDLVWPDITQSGANAGSGSFTFVARSTAQELAGYPAQKVQFDY